MIPTKKLRKAMHEIAAKKGEFTFFGLFLREDALFDHWDLVVSAPWLKKEKFDAIGQLHELLVAALGKVARREIYGLVPIRPDSANLKAVVSAYPVEDGEIRVRRTCLFGLEIEEAIILQSRRPPRKIRVKPSRRRARAA